MRQPFWTTTNKWLALLVIVLALLWVRALSRNRDNYDQYVREQEQRERDADRENGIVPIDELEYE